MSAPVNAPQARERGATTVVSAVVATGVVVGWLAYDHWLYPRVMQRVIDPGSIHTLNEWYLYALVDAMVRWYLPYALVLLLWGRTRPRRLGAAACALATGLYMWLLWMVFVKWIWSDHGSAAAPSDAYEWANLLVISFGLALAWGIARRRGRLWAVGLVTAPLLAAITLELRFHSTWWQRHLIYSDGHTHDVLRQVAFIAPAVVSAVICWLIDAASTRRAAAPGTELVLETDASV